MKVDWLSDGYGLSGYRGMLSESIPHQSHYPVMIGTSTRYKSQVLTNIHDSLQPVSQASSTYYTVAEK